MSEQGHSEREPWLVSARGRLAVEDDGPAAVGTARTASRGACWCLPGRRSATSSCWASRGRWADLGECVAGRRGDARGPRGIRLGDTTSAVACVVAALPLLLLHREHRHRSVDRAATPGPSCPISGEAWVDRVGRLTRPVTPWVVSHALRPWRRHAGAPVQLPLGARRWLGDVADPGSLVTAAGIANGTSSSLCRRPTLHRRARSGRDDHGPDLVRCGLHVVQPSTVLNGGLDQLRLGADCLPSAGAADREVSALGFR